MIVDFLITSDQSEEILLKFIGSLNVYAKKQKSEITLTIVDGLRRYQKQQPNKDEVFENLNIRWILPKKKTTQLESIYLGLSLVRNETTMIMPPDAYYVLDKMCLFEKHLTAGCELIGGKRAIREDVSKLQLVISAFLSWYARRMLRFEITDVNTSIGVWSADAIRTFKMIYGLTPSPRLFLCDYYSNAVSEVELNMFEPKITNRKTSYNFINKLHSLLSFLSEVLMYKSWRGKKENVKYFQ